MTDGFLLGTIPKGTVVHQDEDGYYFVLPDGTTRRFTIDRSKNPPTVIQTDISPNLDVSVGVSKLDWKGW